MSPTPGRSTLITSAPNHASNCVQVGPDWTCVKSRMRTPSSALPEVFTVMAVSSLSCDVYRFYVYLYIVCAIVPGAYTVGSTQMLMTALLPVLAIDSRARCNAPAIFDASYTSSP